MKGGLALATVNGLPASRHVMSNAYSVSITTSIMLMQNVLELLSQNRGWHILYYKLAFINNPSITEAFHCSDILGQYYMNNVKFCSFDPQKYGTLWAPVSSILLYSTLLPVKIYTGLNHSVDGSQTSFSNYYVYGPVNENRDQANACPFSLNGVIVGLYRK